MDNEDIKAVCRFLSYIGIAVAGAIAGYGMCWLELDKLARWAGACE